MVVVMRLAKTIHPIYNLLSAEISTATNTNALCIVTNHPRLALLSVAAQVGLRRQFNAFVLVNL